MSPDQVSRAIRQALERGLVTRRQLRERGRARGRRVESLVSGALEALPS
jgi:DNA-binding MarR family transcriptional regulator